MLGEDTLPGEPSPEFWPLNLDSVIVKVQYNLDSS